MDLSKAQTIHDTITEFMKARFTGSLVFEIRLFQGGITSTIFNHKAELFPLKNDKGVDL